MISSRRIYLLCVSVCVFAFHLTIALAVKPCLCLRFLEKQPWNATDVQIHLSELHKSKQDH